MQDFLNYIRGWSTLVLSLFWMLVRLIPRGINHLRRGRYLLLFWKRLIEEGIIIVIPPADTDSVIKGTQSHDFQGIKNVEDGLRNISNKRLTWVRSDQLGSTELPSHLLIASGPIPNQTTHYLLEQRNQSLYHFDLNNF